MQPNIIYIVKNYTIPSRKFSDPHNVYVPSRLVPWGLIVNNILFYVVKCNKKIELEWKSIDNEEIENSIDTQLHAKKYTMEKIINILNLVLSENKNENNQTIQSRMVDAITFTENNNNNQMFAKKFYTKNIRCTNECIMM